MNDLTFTNYIECLVAGLLGMCLHLVVKIRGIKARAKVANENFDIASYLKDDCMAIASSFVTVLIFLLILDEVLGIKPAVRPYLKFGFIFVGFTGSSILISVLGTAQDKLNKVIDIKTDIADKK